MGPDDQLSDEERRKLSNELIPMLRRLNPRWSDNEILEAAERMADLRTLDEENG